MASAIQVDKSANTPEEEARRQKLEKALYERALKFIENRRNMPLVEEDPTKDEWVHQEVLEDGIVTMAQRQVTGITPKKL